MPWGPCGREERRRLGGGVCRPAVRWERGAWLAGRDSGRRDSRLELHQLTPTCSLAAAIGGGLAARCVSVCVDVHAAGLPRNCRTLVRVLRWAALVLGRRVP